MTEFIIRSLGPTKQKFTFWCFDYFSSFSGARFVNSRRPNAELELCLPLLGAAYRRLAADDSLLSAWTHFLRWRKSPLIIGLITNSEDFPLFAFEKEAFLKYSFLEFLAALWILNLHDRPSCPDFSSAEDKILEFVVPLANEWRIKFHECQESLRFVPEIGRFVPRGLSIGRR